MSSYKPEGYNSVSPYLIVTGAEKMINLLIEVFGGVPTRRFNTPEGKIMHAEVKIQDSIVMISEASAQYPQNNTLLHVYVENSDETYQRALAFGCEDQGAPKTAEGDSDKRGMFKDFAGNLWAVSTQQS
ncbi:VOC family protein [Pedobacter faecalis]|uniref:VOC family protein n=1 Tax=Pedobacter faecalis TaxID=3041495 RepID=UPI0025519A20|nr:VOC family protein [Pedobacter sp. ELA7]